MHSHSACHFHQLVHSKAALLANSEIPMRHDEREKERHPAHNRLSIFLPSIFPSSRGSNRGSSKAYLKMTPRKFSHRKLLPVLEFRNSLRLATLLSLTSFSVCWVLLGNAYMKDKTALNPEGMCLCGTVEVVLSGITNCQYCILYLCDDYAPFPALSRALLAPASLKIMTSPCATSFSSTGMKFKNLYVGIGRGSKSTWRSCASIRKRESQVRWSECRYGPFLPSPATSM